MPIIKTNYMLASLKIWKTLEKHGKEVAPEFFDYDKEDVKEKRNKKIAYSYKEGKQTLGRIAGIINYNDACLNIEALAVEKEARGKHIGSQLLKIVEDEAIACGCKIAFVDTFNFSAPDFYKREGYTQLGAIEGYPEKGITKIWFYKKYN